MRQRTPIVSLLAAVAVAACSGATTTIGGDDGDSGASSDGGGATDGTANDGGAPDSANPAQDSSLPAVDANGGRVDAKIVITQLSESCQPPVANDPVTLLGTLTLSNGTAATIGPGAITLGAFLEPGTAKLVATFNVDKNGIAAIPAGTSATIPLAKTSGSLSKPNGCSTLQCGTSYIVELAVVGTGVPVGTRLRTDPIMVTCTQ